MLTLQTRIFNRTIDEQIADEHNTRVLACAGYLVHPSDFLGFFAEISIGVSSFPLCWLPSSSTYYEGKQFSEWTEVDIRLDF